MKEVSVYECDICGMRFDSEIECTCHELAEEYWQLFQASNAQYQVIFWDCRGERLPIEFAIGNSEEVAAMRIEGSEALIDWCNKMGRVLDFETPWFQLGHKPKLNCTYVIDDDSDYYNREWKEAEAELQYLKNKTTDWEEKINLFKY